MHSNCSQLTDKWGTGSDNVATRHYYYCVMRGSCIGMTSSWVAKPVQLDIVQYRPIYRHIMSGERGGWEGGKRDGDKKRGKRGSVRTPR